MNNNKITYSIGTMGSMTSDIATCKCGARAIGMDRMDAYRNLIRTHECEQ